MKKREMSMEARIEKMREASNSHQIRMQELQKNKMDNQEKITLVNTGIINQLLEKIPLRFRDKTFTDFKVNNEKQLRVKNLIERYIQTFPDRMKEGTSIKFMGNPGTGKTFLSLIMYQELVKAGYCVKYESSIEVVKNLLEIKFKSQTTFQSYLEALKRVQFLIIDEISESINKGGMPSELEKQLLFKIINDRYENKLCTLIITNKDNHGLIEALGLPSVERLSENGITLKFDWPSFRTNPIKI